ncbi:MAG: efflux RND transporter periplasmic adaptor subunit [Rubrivivax sp.]
MAVKKLHLAVAVIGIAAIGTAAWWYQNKGNPVPAKEAGAQGAASGQGPGGAPGGGGAKGGPGGSGGPGGPGGPGGRGPGGPPAVELGKVETARLEDDTQAVGTLRSRQGVVLRPETSGRVQTLSFNDGQRVRKGELLVQLDDTLQRAQLKQAEASASIARTNLQRSRELAAQNFVSQSAVDQNAAALEVALAQVQLAQAQLLRMQVYAPFDGIVGIRSVNVGDYVKDGADLVTVEDLSSVWVDFRLPERFVARVRTGQSVELVLDALPGRKFSARIDALDSQLDANGRSVLVRARLNNSDGLLRSGMFARVRAVFEVRGKALVVPEEALVPVGERQFVFRVVDGPEGGKVAQRVPVTVGMRMPGKAKIVQGLKEGEAIVVAGQSRLMRGDNIAVRVVDLSRPRGGQGGPGGAGDKAGKGGDAAAAGKGADPAAAGKGGAAAAAAKGGGAPAPGKAGEAPAPGKGAEGSRGEPAGAKGAGARAPAGGASAPAGPRK